MAGTSIPGNGLGRGQCLFRRADQPPGREDREVAIGPDKDGKADPAMIALLDRAHYLRRADRHAPLPSIWICVSRASIEPDTSRPVTILTSVAMLSACISGPTSRAQPTSSVAARNPRTPQTIPRAAAGRQGDLRAVALRMGIPTNMAVLRGGSEFARRLSQSVGPRFRRDVQWRSRRRTFEANTRAMLSALSAAMTKGVRPPITSLR